MMIPVSWEHLVTWLVLCFILLSVVSDKIRYDLTAFAGLLGLGLLGFRETERLFSGFSDPALFTIAVVLVLSTGLAESGILTGLGQSIARKVHDPDRQILSVSAVTVLLSSMMNNVGAVGLILPTVQRMARRAGLDPALYGLPIAYASILGGSLTLIGTSSNIIVSAFRMQASGKPFQMFDFAPQGVAMVMAGLILWYILHLRHKKLPDREASLPSQTHDTNDDIHDFDELFIAPLRTFRNTTIVLVFFLPALLLTSIGLIHPAVAFGLVVMVLLATDILPYDKAYASLNLPVLIFMGSMISVANVMQENGSLSLVVNQLIPFLQTLPPWLMIYFILLLTTLISNILNNAVAAVLMSPTAIILAQSGLLNISVDALLMAVAAGASLGIILPTNQSTLIVMSSTSFSRKSFIKIGAVLFLVSGIIASLVIYMIWL
ncbi:MAG TPA: SLC13 family permease [Syntrophomonas sp.]|nr:SLC13 family permease [Syntrophomonas sp.]